MNRLLIIAIATLQIKVIKIYCIKSTNTDCKRIEKLGFDFAMEQTNKHNIEYTIKRGK